MGYIAAELTKGWMMEGVGEQVIFRIILSLALVNGPASVILQV